MLNLTVCSTISFEESVYGKLDYFYVYPINAAGPAGKGNIIMLLSKMFEMTQNERNVSRPTHLSLPVRLLMYVLL